MDRTTFQENYKLSRGQVDRLLAKARENGGRFDLPDCGTFRVKKSGNGKTAPLDITPVRAAASPSPSIPSAPDPADYGAEVLPLPESLALPPDLARLGKTELDRLLVAANVLKVRQTTESEKRRIRADVIAETVTAVSMAFSPLRRVIDDLRLPGEQLDRLRAALLESLDQLEQVGNNGE